MLEVSRLRIAREDKVILRGLDWRVAPGQHWVILGPNGSGKSSLLAALTGYFAPTSGSLSVLGETFGRSDWRELPVISAVMPIRKGPRTAANLPIML